ncbi:MAG: 50S ribosomal protein L10 [Gemmatimonadetes bacterium]|nr:50S ribosomal protein L10 [Gemmatimonadota bacterium]NNL30731.1 50S ribosomal protein L10 [Gemmatimonadota bacterium]
MDKATKETFVSELRERVSRAPVLYLTDFTGLKVKEMTELRGLLRDSGAEYVVIKNRLAKRVIAESDELPDISESLVGPTGWVFGYEDAAAAAKVLSDFAKAHDSKPAFKLGVLENEILQPEQVEKIAKLPPKEQLYAELAGALQAPMSNLAYALEAKLQETAGLLDALIVERAEAG